MIESPASNQSSTSHQAIRPKFSIIIPVYNDWIPLNECLKSLAQQANPPSFEIIVVDDGSKESVPEFFSKWQEHFSVTVIRKFHAGIASARNRGIQASKAPICLFVDADCRLDVDCLQMLERTVNAFPEQDYFQLHLVGDCCNGLVGKAEELRLRVLQHQFVGLGGYIRYLNTAAFALRRNEGTSSASPFDPMAIRAEDTLLLANLIKGGKLPLFVPDAVVQHTTPLRLVAYLRKAMRSAYLEGGAFDIISASKIKIRLHHKERLSMLGCAWQLSADTNIGRTAWFVLLTRQTLRLISSFCYRHLRRKFSCSLKLADSL